MVHGIVIGKFSDYQRAKLWIENVLPKDAPTLLATAKDILDQGYQYIVIHDNLKKPNGRTLTIPSPQLSENQAVITN